MFLLICLIKPVPVSGKFACRRILHPGAFFINKKKPGNDLLSHLKAVPSAQEGLTSVFGMGTGGTPPLSLPGYYSPHKHTSFSSICVHTVILSKGNLIIWSSLTAY